MPTIVGHETAGPTATAQTSVTVDRPSGVSAGTLLIARVVIGGNSNSPVTDVDWTEVRHDSGSTSQFHPQQYILTRVAGASEPSDYEFSRGASSVYWFVEIIAVDAHDGLDTHDGDGSTSGSTLTLPDVTATDDGSLYIGFWGAWRTSRSGTWDTPPASMTELVNLPESGSSDQPAAMSASETVDSGATGTRSTTLSGDIDRLAGSVVIVAPGVDLPTAAPDPVTVTVTAHTGSASVATVPLTAQPDPVAVDVTAHTGVAFVPESPTAAPDPARVSVSAHTGSAYVPPVAVPDPGHVHASAHTGRASRAGDSITAQPDAATIVVTAHTGEASGGVGLADMGGDMAFTIVGTARLVQDPQVSPVPDGVALRRIKRVAETMPDPVLDEGVPVG